MYNDQRKYELKDIDDKLLGRLSVFLPKFFANLYEDPKIVSLIIKNSKPSETQRTLLPLFGIFMIYFHKKNSLILILLISCLLLLL